MMRKQGGIILISVLVLTALMMLLVMLSLQNSDLQKRMSRYLFYTAQNIAISNTAMQSVYESVKKEKQSKDKTACELSALKPEEIIMQSPSWWHSAKNACQKTHQKIRYQYFVQAQPIMDFCLFFDDEHMNQSFRFFLRSEYKLSSFILMAVVNIPVAPQESCPKKKKIDRIWESWVRIV